MPPNRGSVKIVNPVFNLKFTLWCHFAAESGPRTARPCTDAERMSFDLRLINEVENAIATGSVERRNTALRRVTDLFLVGSEQYSDDEIALFDDVIIRLAAEIELSARSLLAVRLAPIPNAPPKTIRALAFDDAIEVARPVLAQSERLDDRTLVENGREKSQEHLLAISRRRTLSETVTDVLVQRGNQRVVLSAAENGGARFSDLGLAILVQRSAGDDRLAACVGSRPEIPPHLFLDLLAKASHIVRAKLEVEHPQAKRKVQQVVEEAAEHIRTEALDGLPDRAAARALVESLHRSGELDDGKLRMFAKDGRPEEITAAVALMCEISLQFVERAMMQERPETVLVLARAVGLSWSTIKAILLLRTGKRIIAADEVAQCLARFERLKPATAKEILRFYQKRDLAGTKRPA
jgi:uncharacterized protein (DUF2336 family)